jgi:hypothetical protein
VRVLQRSVYQAQSAQKNTVYAMNVLVSIFAEKESYAVYLLKLNRHLSNAYRAVDTQKKCSMFLHFLRVKLTIICIYEVAVEAQYYTFI